MSAPGEWLGLLKWSLAYQDGTGQSAATEMSAEKRQWLEKAMEELVVDEAKLMAEAVDRLVEGAAGGLPAGDEARDQFENLTEIVENLDAASNLVKMGKIEPLVEMLRSDLSLFRSGAAQVIAVCAQNNPYCQAALLQLGALAYVTHMAVNDPDPATRLKATLAVSCLVRNCREAERAFVDCGDGLLVLTNGLRQPQPRYTAKCLYLLVFLLSPNPELRDQATLDRHVTITREAGAAGLAAGLLGYEDTNNRLGSAQLLGLLGELDPEVMQQVEARLLVAQAAGEELQDELELLQALVG